MTGPILTQPEIDAMLYGEAEMTTEQRAREWLDKMGIRASVDNISRTHSLSAVINCAIADERRACWLAAKNYSTDGCLDGCQVASEIAQAIAGRG